MRDSFKDVIEDALSNWYIKLIIVMFILCTTILAFLWVYVSYTNDVEKAYQDGYDEGMKKFDSVTAEEIENARSEVSESTYDSGYYKGYDEGYNRGYKDGLEEKKNYSYEDGYDRGYEDGYDDAAMEELEILADQYEKEYRDYYD